MHNESSDWQPPSKSNGTSFQVSTEPICPTVAVMESLQTTADVKHKTDTQPSFFFFRSIITGKKNV